MTLPTTVSQAPSFVRRRSVHRVIQQFQGSSVLRCACLHHEVCFCRSRSKVLSSLMFSWHHHAPRTLSDWPDSAGISSWLVVCLSILVGVHRHVPGTCDRLVHAIGHCNSHVQHLPFERWVELPSCASVQSPSIFATLLHKSVREEPMRVNYCPIGPQPEAIYYTNFCCARSVGN